MEEATLGATVRELGRHAAAMLDEIERSGRCIVISRHGRAVAFLGPIPEDYVPGDFERVHVTAVFQGTGPLVTEERAAEVTDEEIAELADEERYMLARIADAWPHWWMPTSTEELHMAGPRMRLEERDLVVGMPGGGWKVTARGAEAASRVTKGAAR